MIEPTLINKKEVMECEINGERVQYDTCYAHPPYDDIKSYYEEHFDYLGAGNKIWIDGVDQEISQNGTIHFFKLKAK